VIPDGVENQKAYLSHWLFSGNDLVYSEAGDLVFFSEERADKLTHVGLVEERIKRSRISIIHASETCGGMNRAIWDCENNRFRDSYLAFYVAKMQPFLFWVFLEHQIKREIKCRQDQLRML
jgi:hypothetical protein